MSHISVGSKLITKMDCQPNSRDFKTKGLYRRMESYNLIFMERWLYLPTEILSSLIKHKKSAYFLVKRNMEFIF